MNMKKSVLILSILLILFGGIFLANALGLWETESSKQPSKFTSGEFEGQADPADIRGSYSFADIENVFDIEVELIAKAFNIESNDPSAIKASELEEIYSGLGEGIDVGTGSVRLFVSLYTGLPYDMNEYLLDTAVEVLKEQNKWNDDMEVRMDGYILSTEDMELISLETEIVAEEHDEEEKTQVSGNSTVADAISLGISIEEIEEILGVEVENINMGIRDLCEQNGLQFGNVKNHLNELLN